MIEFEVSDVAPATRPRAELDPSAEYSRLLQDRIEQVGATGAHLVSCSDLHGLVQAADIAFFEHRPLVISPDVVWYCIAQGFALHLNRNPEKYRGRSVQHEGRLKLQVVRPDFQLGKTNPWQEAFAAFSEQIGEHIGKTRDLIVADFSTTGPVERAASEVVLMDAFQAYFEYEMLIGCGIPRVTLLGTQSDWESIRVRAGVLAEYGLDKWIAALLPVLDKLVETAGGSPDREFWESFYRYRSGSQPADLSGWIHVLFPYLNTFESGSGGFEVVGDKPEDELRPSDLIMKPPVPSGLVENRWLEDWETDLGGWEKRLGKWDEAGPSLGDIPSSLSAAPVRVEDAATGTMVDMQFVAGLFGVVSTPRGLAPHFNWAVTYVETDNG